MMFVICAAVGVIVGGAVGYTVGMMAAFKAIAAFMEGETDYVKGH